MSSFWSIFRRHIDGKEDKKDKKDRKREKKHAIHNEERPATAPAQPMPQAPEPPPAAAWQAPDVRPEHETTMRSPPPSACQQGRPRRSQSLRTSWAPTDPPIILEERVPFSRRPSHRHGRRTSYKPSQRSTLYSDVSTGPLPQDSADHGMYGSSPPNPHGSVLPSRRASVTNRNQGQQDADPLGERRHEEARSRQREAYYRREQEQAAQEKLELRESVRNLNDRLAALEAHQRGQAAHASAQGSSHRHTHSRHDSAYQAPFVTAADDDDADDDDCTSFEEDVIPSRYEHDTQHLEPASMDNAQLAQSGHRPRGGANQQSDFAPHHRSRPRPHPINTQVESISFRNEPPIVRSSTISRASSDQYARSSSVREGSTHTRSNSAPFIGAAAAPVVRDDHSPAQLGTRVPPSPQQRSSPLSRGPSTSRRARADRSSFGTPTAQPGPRCRTHLYERGHDTERASINEAQAHIDSARRAAQQQSLGPGSSRASTSAHGSNESSKKPSPAGNMRRSRHSVDLRAENEVDRTRSVDRGDGNRPERRVKDDDPIEDVEPRRGDQQDSQTRRRRSARPTSWFV